MWPSKRSSNGAPITSIDNNGTAAPGKISGTVVADAQPVAPSESTTLAPSRTRHVQPTGFDVSPEAVARARANEGSQPPVDTSYMSEEYKAKLRAKGINPELKAEMDAKVYRKQDGKGSGWSGLWRLSCLGCAW